MGRRGRPSEDEEDTELLDAWSRWRTEIPDRERERVADIVGRSDLTTKPGINSLAQAILVEVFRGTLSPVVLTAAKPWIELIIFNIDSMNTVAGLGQRGTVFDTMAMIADLQNRVKPLQPVYLVSQLPDKKEIIEHDKEGVIDAVKVSS